MNHFNILPTIGLGEIKFLISIDQFVDLVGKPDADELLREKTSYLNSRILHYDSLGLSASFDEEHNWKLTSITVTDGNFHLEDNYLFSKSKPYILELIKTLNLGDYVTDIFSEEGYNSTTIYFEKKNISFWFENDELQEIQWGIIQV